MSNEDKPYVVTKEFLKWVQMKERNKEALVDLVLHATPDGDNELEVNVTQMLQAGDNIQARLAQLITGGMGIHERYGRPPQGGTGLLRASDDSPGKPAPPAKGT